MAYADADFYKNTFTGTIIPDEDVGSYLAKASDDIDRMTYNRIVARGLENLSAYQQAQVKKATCAQAEFLYQYGEFTNLPLKSFSAGSVSISLGEEVNGVMASKTAKLYLDPTGFVDRRL